VGGLVHPPLSVLYESRGNCPLGSVKKFGVSVFAELRAPNAKISNPPKGVLRVVPGGGAVPGGEPHGIKVFCEGRGT